MPSLVKLGIYVGRPTSGSNQYSYLVIPKREAEGDVIDALETSKVIPMREMYIINSNRQVPLLRKLYIVRYVRRDVMKAGTFLTEAVVKGVERAIPLEELETRASEVDEVFVSEYKEDPRIDEDFVRDLFRFTGAVMPKRTLATQVLFKINDPEVGMVHVLVPLPEAFLYLQANPGILHKRLYFENYMFTIFITRDPLDKEEFAEEIVDNMKHSVQAFENIRRNLLTLEAGGEVEE